MTRLLPAALVAALSTLTLTSAHAQIFGGDEQARRQVVELRQETATRFDAIGRGQLELSNQNELLRAEIATLRGQIEILLHEIELLKQRQHDFYVDLDDRLRRAEQPSAVVPRGDPAAEASSYEAALNLLKGGKHTEALTAFQQFIAQYPQSSMLPGATFWAGNAALQAKEIAAARNLFETVISNWPEDGVASDAMLGLANSQQLMGDGRSAQETLKQVIARYPRSSAAQVAAQRLGAQQ